ncbi:MAG: hypothetical protein QXJ75_05675 [Candidatus Bathyarchaeia archaeon]
MANYQVKLGGVERVFTYLEVEERISSADTARVELAEIEPISLGDTFQIYRDGTLVFAGKVNVLDASFGLMGERHGPSGRDLSDALFKLLTGSQSWSETDVKTIVQTLFAGTGLTEGYITNPFNVFHRWLQTSDSDFGGDTLTRLVVSGSGSDAKVIFDDTAASAEVDQYYYTYDTWRSMRSYYLTQTFTPSYNSKLFKARIQVYSYGNNGAYSITMRVKATDTSGKPTGSDLASATVTAPSSSGYHWLTFTFASPPTLSGGTKYALVVDRNSSLPYDLCWLLHSSYGAYGGGSAGYSTDGSTWNMSVYDDHVFETYKTAMSGNIRSVGISPSSLQGWLKFDAGYVRPSGTNLTFDILDNNNNVISGYGGITTDQLPKDISGINKTTYPTIKVRANFTRTINTVTPELLNWTVEYYSNCISLTVDYEYRIEAIRRLADIVGAEFYVSPEGKYYFLKQRGTDRSDTIIYQSGVNAEEIQRAPRSNLRQVKKIIVIGAGAGAERIMQTLTADGYVPGDPEMVYINKDISSTDEAISAGQTLLNLHKDPQETITVKTKTHFNVSPGDTVKIVDAHMGINGKYRIQLKRCRYSPLEGESFELECSQQCRELFDELLRIGELERWLK